MFGFSWGLPSRLVGGRLPPASSRGLPPCVSGLKFSLPVRTPVALD